MKKKICVFCSSSEDLDKKYYEMGENFGKRLALENYDLVHGGGSIGIMGRIMKSAYEYGANVVGVVPEKLNKENIVSDNYQTLVVTPDMKLRKEYMRNISSAFVALPGGFGTLEELLEIITLKQLKYHYKPIIIFNYLSIFDNLIELFDDIYRENFANPDYKQLYFIANNTDEIFEYLRTYEPKNIYDKYLKH